MWIKNVQKLEGHIYQILPAFNILFFLIIEIRYGKYRIFDIFQVFNKYLLQFSTFTFYKIINQSKIMLINLIRKIKIKMV